MERYRDAGLTYLALEPRARDANEFLGQMERFAGEVMQGVWGDSTGTDSLIQSFPPA